MSGPISKKNYLDRDDRPEAVTDNIIPSAPSWLNTRSKRIFKKTAQQVVQMGIGGSFDVNIIAQYSSLLDTFMTMEEAAEADPKVRLSQLNAIIKLHTMILQLCKELGLSPLSRAKLRIVKVEEKQAIEESLDNE